MEIEDRERRQIGKTLWREDTTCVFVNWIGHKGEGKIKQGYRTCSLREQKEIKYYLRSANLGGEKMAFLG